MFGHSAKRVEPGPGQESVWDYPRPPRLEPSSRHIGIVFNSITVANTRRAWRVLETSHPPVYYIPPEDIQMQYLTPAPGRSLCEWKGQARYYTLTVDDRTADSAAWYYPTPSPAFAPITGYVAFYPSRMDACFVDGERVFSPTGRFLRRLDHDGHRGAVQRRSRHAGLVVCGSYAPLFAPGQQPCYSPQSVLHPALC